MMFVMAPRSPGYSGSPSVVPWRGLLTASSSDPMNTAMIVPARWRGRHPGHGQGTFSVVAMVTSVTAPIWRARRPTLARRARLARRNEHVWVCPSGWAVSGQG